MRTLADIGKLAYFWLDKLAYFWLGKIADRPSRRALERLVALPDSLARLYIRPRVSHLATGKDRWLAVA
jgi:hypothetical protein